jgi:hypothetical protein
MLGRAMRFASCHPPAQNRKPPVFRQRPIQVNTMVTETSEGTPLPPEQDFDNAAKKGWEFFTKFLLTNVLVTAAALIFVGLLTVWR